MPARTETTTPATANPAVEAAFKGTIPVDAAPQIARWRDAADRQLARRLAGRAKRTPRVRRDLVRRVRAEIAAGAYETPERIEAAAEALLADLPAEEPGQERCG